LSTSALVVRHIAAGPEFKVTSLTARIGATTCMVDNGSGRAREGWEGRWMEREAMREGPRRAEKEEVTGKGWVIREGKAKP